MNDEWLRHRKKTEKIGYRSVGRLGGPHFFSCSIFSMDFSEPQRGGWQGRLRSCPVVSHVMFFSKIGGISSKYSSFTVFTLRTCSCGWMDGRLFVNSYYEHQPYSLSLSSSLSIPRPPTNQPKQSSSSQSSMIILSNTHTHPLRKSPQAKKTRRSAESGFSCPVPFWPLLHR